MRFCEWPRGWCFRPTGCRAGGLLGLSGGGRVDPSGDLLTRARGQLAGLGEADGGIAAQSGLAGLAAECEPEDPALRPGLGRDQIEAAAVAVPARRRRLHALVGQFRNGHRARPSSLTIYLTDDGWMIPHKARQGQAVNRAEPRVSGGSGGRGQATKNRGLAEREGNSSVQPNPLFF